MDTPNGGFYFTSPYASRTEPKGTVYYVDKLGEVHVVADNLGFPNGIVLRPGGETLLVGESLYNRVLEFAVDSPGKLGVRRVFAELPAKGEAQPAAKPDKPAASQAKEAKKLRGRLPAYYGKVVSDKQRQEIYKIQAKFNEQIMKLKEQLAELVTKRDTEVEQVLSDEQRAEIAKLKEARRSRRSSSEKDTTASGQ